MGPVGDARRGLRASAAVRADHPPAQLAEEAGVVGLCVCRGGERGSGNGENKDGGQATNGHATGLPQEAVTLAQNLDGYALPAVIHRDPVHAPLRAIRASFRLALGPGLGPGPRLALGRDPFGQLRASRLAVPLFEGLVGDLALDQELRELPALGLALEWHFSLSASHKLGGHGQDRNLDVRDIARALPTQVRGFPALDPLRVGHEIDDRS